MQQMVVVKFIGIHIDSQLNWHAHIAKKQSKNEILSVCLKWNKTFTLKEYLLTLFFSISHSHGINYGIALWDSAHQTYTKQLYIPQKKALKAIKTSAYNACTNAFFSEL